MIVVNDGGSSVEESLLKLDAGSRLVSLRLPLARERSAARNAGLALARNEWITFLDDDDWWNEDHLSGLLEHARHARARIVYSDARMVLEEPRPGAPAGYAATGEQIMTLPNFDRTQLLIGNFIPILCALVHRDCFAEAGGFDESLSTHEDWDLWLRLSSRASFHHVPRVSANISWRDDGSSTTSSRHNDFARTCALIHERNRPEAERLPGVVEAQQRYLDAMRARHAATARRPHVGVPTGLPDEMPGRVPALVPAVEGPDSEQALAAAKLALAESRLGEARTHLDRLLAQTPSHGEGWLTEGVLSIQELDYPRAASAFERAIEFGADARRSRLGFAMAALGADRAGEAWDTLAELEMRAPGDTEITYWLIRAGVVLERWDALAVHLGEHLEIRPEDHATRFALAGIQLRRGAVVEAEKIHGELLRRAPQLGGLDDLASALVNAVAS